MLEFFQKIQSKTRSLFPTIKSQGYAESQTTEETTPAELSEDEFLDLFSPDPTVAVIRDVLSFDEISDENEDDQQDVPVPLAFQWAEQTSTEVSKRFAGLSMSGFSSVGQAMSGFMNIFTSCGIVCAHSLGAVANMGSSMGSLAGVAGSAGGLNFDGRGNVSFSGSVNELSKRTGLSSKDILSGKYSVDDILTLMIESFGKGLEMVGFGLITCLIDGFIPTPQRAGA